MVEDDALYLVAIRDTIASNSSSFLFAIATRRSVVPNVDSKRITSFPSLFALFDHNQKAFQTTVFAYLIHISVDLSIR